MKRLRRVVQPSRRADKGDRKLRELVRTNDMVLVSAVGALLDVAKRVAGIELILVEVDEALAGLARGNAGSNAIAADAVVLDVTSTAEAFAAAGLSPDSVDVVLMNPPFNDAARHRASPDKAR